MYFWNRYPFVRFAFALILGIVCFPLLPNMWSQPIPLLGGLFLALLVSTLISQKVGFYQLRHINGLLALLLLFSIGGWLVKSNYHSLPSDHCSNINYVEGFSGTIIDDGSEREKYYRYVFELDQGVMGDSTFSLSGKIHLYTRKDTSNHQVFHYGDQLLVSGNYFSVPGPKNPHEFDYKEYLRLQHIHAQAFIDPQKIKQTGNSPVNPILGWAYKMRSSAKDILDRNLKNPRENGIAKALLLGIKDHLDNDLKKSYASAGAMHVLAVSGLHVGIIYLLLEYLLAGLKATSKGRIVFGVVTILIIWLYACVTGLSPSVMRAATMFSIISLSRLTAREGNIYNTLGIAAFTLLLYDPYLIYSVGFQLSFAAVFGIVYLQPRLYGLLTFHTWILDKAWAITCVSIGAQLATFPLTAYYFHQFPTYFLLSNLVVIPAATAILVLGIGVLVLDPIVGFLANALGWLLEGFIWVINEVVTWIESLPLSLIEWIYLDFSGLFFVYAIMLTLISALHYRSFKTLVVFSMLFILFSGSSFIKKRNDANKHRIIFYEIQDATAIDHIHGINATLFVDDFAKEELALLEYQIDPGRLVNHLPPIREGVTPFTEAQTFKKSGVFTNGILGDQKILIVDSTTFHLSFEQVINTNVLLIENESVKSLSWLQDHFKYDHLLIGNKNSFFYSKRMKEQAKKMNISLHSLKLDGAYAIELLH